MFGYFPRPAERRRQQAGTLSGGEQQMLAVSRALMLRPAPLLDELRSLAPLVVRELSDILRAVIEREGVSMLVVEQNAAMALESLARLPHGNRPRRALGGAAQMKSDDAVRRSYLGYWRP